MHDRAKEQKKMQIYGMNPAAKELLPIYLETLYEDDGKEALFERIHGTDSPKVLICLKKEDVTPDTVAMLEKMLLACQLKPEEVTQIAVPDTLSPRVLRMFQSTYVILFGVELDQTVFRLGKGLNIPFKFHGRKWLLSDSLSEILANASKKSALWKMGLKVLFGI